MKKQVFNSIRLEDDRDINYAIISPDHRYILCGSRSKISGEESYSNFLIDAYSGEIVQEFQSIGEPHFGYNSDDLLSMVYVQKGVDGQIAKIESPVSIFYYFELSKILLPLFIPNDNLYQKANFIETINATKSILKREDVMELLRIINE